MKLLILFLFSFSALALKVNVQWNTCDAPLNSSAGGSCDQFDDKIAAEMNKNLPDVNIQTYADGMANANVVGNAGLGSDYGQNFDLFTLKLVPLAVGFDASDGGFDNLDKASGIYVGGRLTAGLNLDLLPIASIGFVEMKRLDVLVNFMDYSIEEDLDESTAKGDVSGFGVMARYRIMDSVGSPYLAQWGGLHLHTGVQSTSMDINYTQTFTDQDFNDPDSGLSGRFVNAFANLDLESESTTIPIEVSTYARFLYAFTLYGGLGFDIASGSSKVQFAGSGQMRGGTTANSNEYISDITANESASSDPEATGFRGFVGLQLNAPVVSLYVHLNKRLAEDVAGVNFGLNIAW